MGPFKFIMKSQSKQVSYTADTDITQLIKKKNRYFGLKSDIILTCKARITQQWRIRKLLTSHSSYGFASWIWPLLPCIIAFILNITYNGKLWRVYYRLKASLSMMWYLSKQNVSVHPHSGYHCYINLQNNWGDFARALRNYTLFPT